MGPERRLQLWREVSPTILLLDGALTFHSGTCDVSTNGAVSIFDLNGITDQSQFMVDRLRIDGESPVEQFKVVSGHLLPASLISD